MSVLEVCIFWGGGFFEAGSFVILWSLFRYVYLSCGMFDLSCLLRGFLDICVESQLSMSLSSLVVVVVDVVLQER